jgi:hypothetical protein
MEKTNWARSDLIKKLLENIVTVEFTKVNGDYRKMECTLQQSYLPESDKINKDESRSSLSVWDINANGWRSFRWDSLKEYSVESA